MIKLVRTNSADTDFLTLVQSLDEYLKMKDGDDHPFYAQYNKSDSIPYVVLAMNNGKAVGCGAIKGYSESAAEIKRMFILPEYRGKGIAKKILKELELWASELQFDHCILETGKRQTEAVQLYLGCGYEITGNYGQYEGVGNSICMKKAIH